MSVEQNFGLHLGQDHGLLFTIYNSAATLATIAAGTATVQDITGYTIELVDRAPANASSPSLRKTATIVSGTAGTCQVQIDAADTSGWYPGIHDFMLRRYGSGVNVPLAYGKITWLAAAAR